MLKLSTTTSLTVVTDKIYNNMDNKRIALLTLCELSKHSIASATTFSWKSY